LIRLLKLNQSFDLLEAPTKKVLLKVSGGESGPQPELRL